MKTGSSAYFIRGFARCCEDNRYWYVILEGGGGGGGRRGRAVDRPSVGFVVPIILSILLAVLAHEWQQRGVDPGVAGSRRWLRWCPI